MKKNAQKRISKRELARALAVKADLQVNGFAAVGRVLGSDAATAYKQLEADMKAAFAAYVARSGLRVVRTAREVGDAALLRRKGHFVVEVGVPSTSRYMPGCEQMVGYEYPAGVRPLTVRAMTAFLASSTFQGAR